LGRGVIVGAPTGDDGDLMAAFDEVSRDFGEVLARGHDVGMEGLVDQEELHLPT
jgi:hypothetical protein